MPDSNINPSPLGTSHRVNSVAEQILPVASGSRKDRRVVWEWNLPLLATSLLLVVVVVAALGGLYYWQSSRLAEGLLKRAASAKQSGDLSEQTRWLARYVSLVPDDVDAQIQLALATDESVKATADLDRARRTLTVAMGACGDAAAYADQKQILREKLISRLVQMGSVWASEAEKQLLELDRPAGDPLATKWMAQALVSQLTGTTYKPRDAKQTSEQSDPWQWLASQPPGDVLYRAWSLNQDDVDLSSSLIAACLEHPEWFQFTGKPAEAASIEKIALQVVDRLEAMDDGRAQWTVYVYSANSKLQTAQQKLEAAAEGAFSRLVQHTATNQKPESASASSQRAEDSSLQALTAPRLDLVADSYQPYWDWQIVSELARLTAASEPEQARKLYQRLLENDSPLQVRQQRESAYAAYGSLVAQLDNLPAAIAIWKKAADLLPESLVLTRLLANAFAVEQDFVQARVHLTDYQSFIDLQTARLSGAYGAQLTTLAKQSIRQRLDLAHWEGLLLQARVNFASTDYREAVKYAQQSFESPLILTSEQRVEAGKILAECYTQLGLWDMAGHTLDRCVTLSPNDLNLRRAATTAWTNVGTADSATLQLEQADDGSFNAALEIARLTARAEATKPADEADQSAVIKAIIEARRRFESAPTEASAVKNVWQLDLLELNYSDAGALSSDSPDSQAANKMDRLQQIAESYPGVSALQMLAASALARAGRYEDNQQAIQRLELIAQTTGKSADAANVAVARANTLAVREGWEPAIVSIRQALRDLPSEALRLAYVGVELALQSKQTKAAYDLLASVPEEQLDTGAFMTLARLGIALRDSASDQVPDLENKLSLWAERLKTIEGAEGTHWRYLEAKRLLFKASTSSTPKEYLNAASRLFNEIDSRRPRWGLAATLGAQIAIAKGTGFTDESIGLLQRAIRDGDRQIGTIWLLVQQLRRVNRLEQAEKELQRIGSFSESYLPMTAMMVDLVQRRGEFDQAAIVARKLAAAKSDDYTSWLLLSQTLMTAGTKVGIADAAKQELLTEAGTALAKAHELSQGRDISVWDARFRFQLVSGDLAAAQQILQELEQSSLPDEPRLLAAGRGYLQLKEYPKARQRFEACLALNPKSSAAYLALSDLHSRLGDADASLDTLRRAQTALPNDTFLRERLVLNLHYGAVGEDAQTEQRSAEIQRLLQDVSPSSAPRTRLVKALIELDKGNTQQQSAARGVMRDIAADSSMEGNDAKRVLANYHARQWFTRSAAEDSAEETAEDKTESQRDFNEAKTFYEQLASMTSPAPLDVARYADFLLKASVLQKKQGHEQLAQGHLATTDRNLQKLESITGSSIVSLQLRVRLALAKGEKDQLETITADWISGAGELEPVQQQKITELAGRILFDLGLVEDSLVWLEQVYDKDPAKYQLFAVALARTQKFERAFQLTLSGYQNQPSAEAATFIAEVAMLRPELATSAEVDQRLQEALKKFNESPQLLEAYATLRMLQERFEEAAVWFQEVEKLAPNRVRTLNNLALALAELPMGKEAAVLKIEKAIELAGRVPELLDSQGIVLHRAGRLDEAKKVLREAAERVNDPRFQLHLAHIALDQNDTKAAQQAYEAADKSKLDIASLNSKERSIWAQLEQQFGKE